MCPQCYCVIILILSASAIFLNGLILCNILGRKTHRALTPSRILLSNLAFVANLAAVLGGFYVCGVDKLFETLWICSVFSYLRNAVTNLFSFSVLGISYERMRSMRTDLIGEFLVARALACIWSVSLVGGVPSLLVTQTVNHTHPDGTVHVICVKTDPWQFNGLGIIWELVRGSVCHVLIPGYLLYELYKLRSKLKYFFTKSPEPRLRKKVERVRFVYMNSLIFALTWTPYGVGLFYYKSIKLHERTQIFLQSDQDLPPERASLPLFLIVSLFYCYTLLLPLIIFCTNHQGPTLSSLFRRPTSSALSKDEEKVEESGTNVAGDTTFAISSGSRVEPVASENLVSDQQVENPSCQANPVILPGETVL